MPGEGSNNAETPRTYQNRRDAVNCGRYLSLTVATHHAQAGREDGWEERTKKKKSSSCSSLDSILSFTGLCSPGKSKKTYLPMVMETQPAVVALWPEDRISQDENRTDCPDHQLAVYLLAAGCTHDYVATRAGFESLRHAQRFARDEETRRAVAELTAERGKRLGKRAMVRLERILAEEHTDLRATVLAIRTAMEVSGDLKSSGAAPTKTVRELTVPELNELIEATKSELQQRITGGRVGETAPRLTSSTGSIR